MQVIVDNTKALPYEADTKFLMDLLPINDTPFCVGFEIGSIWTLLKIGGIASPIPVSTANIHVYERMTSYLGYTAEFVDSESTPNLSIATFTKGAHTSANLTVVKGDV